MPLEPGYNLVTSPVEETNRELPALSFFRRLSVDESVPNRLTVTGLGDLLYYADEAAREETVRILRDVIRDTRSFSGPKAVQFVIDGELVDDDIFTMRIERDGESVYLPVGNLFVERPKVIGSEHAVARK